jgi:hypothetical protein
LKKKLNKKEQKAYLLSKIGEPVGFTYPEGPPREGKLLDRYVIFDSEDDYVVYWDLIDLIEFKGEDENWLRITYYRYKKKQRRWVFAGQTSISNPIGGFVDLFVKAIKEKEWIRPLFREIYKKCAKELLSESKTEKL